MSYSSLYIISLFFKYCCTTVAIHMSVRCYSNIFENKFNFFLNSYPYFHCVLIVTIYSTCCSYRAQPLCPLYSIFTPLFIKTKCGAGNTLSWIQYCTVYWRYDELPKVTIQCTRRALNTVLAMFTVCVFLRDWFYPYCLRIFFCDITPRFQVNDRIFF